MKFRLNNFLDLQSKIIIPCYTDSVIVKMHLMEFLLNHTGRFSLIQERHLAFSSRKTGFILVDGCSAPYKMLRNLH